MHIEKKELGGQIKIDYFSTEDLREILDLINKSSSQKKPDEMLQNHIENEMAKPIIEEAVDDRSKEEKKEDETDLYNISNFSV